MSDFTVMIPARFDSERLPGKVLREIDGRPMIDHVVARATESGARRVVVVTDDERVARAGRAAGVDAIVSKVEHSTGTDRLAEAAAVLGCAEDEIIVNLQGDEPLMPPALLRAVADDLIAHREAAMATLCAPLAAVDADNPNAVKVVLDANGYALFFSRALIPRPRNESAPTSTTLWYRHLGIYAYRAGFLQRFVALAPPAAELLERLEQLRALHHGFRIHVVTANEIPEPGVDTPADLERVRRFFSPWAFR